MTFSVRRIDQAEALASADIIVKAYAAPPWEERWDLDNARRRLAELCSSAGTIALAAFDSDQIVGFVFASPYTSAIGTGLYIAEIAISPSHQRMGIGTMLLSHIEREAVRLRYKQIWLVSRQAGGVADYYRANGFDQSKNLCVYAKAVEQPAASHVA
ncbi:GNAT family N-acetyltransferase [Rhizobium sp. 2MFCol3.1]|uniref:GNAT family N-acetyltransferase n=1 Tax=Rhizobium sp. 2MFCol3.1 TaxID=1246459 RepID=UPI00035C3193|nr:GNAT family N-acetyltransferase [Rhizobium sp. 2MFCol3.1]